MEKIKFKNLSFLLTFYIILLLSSISCLSGKMDILFHKPAAQFDFYICDSTICPDTKFTSVGKTIILDNPDLDSKATDIEWRVTNGPGGATWYPPAKNAKIQSFTPDSSGVYSINISYSAKGTRCSCDFIVDVDISDCNTSICPGSTTIPLGDSTTLDIQGVDSGATQIYWRIVSSPGGATWNPPAKNAITETFTPSEVGTYNLQVSYVVDGYTCSCNFIVNVVPPCDQNICPGSTTITVGDTTTLDIQGVNPLATQINWQILSSPGGATWNPPAKNAITELFTPNSSGFYDIQVSYMLYGQTCSCDFTVEAEKEEPPVIVPLVINWTTSQNGLNSNGGWKISNEGRKIRFDVEDSTNCGGSNSKVQSGVATATITVGEDYIFIPTINGIAELQNSGFEKMTIKLNGKITVEATSRNEMKGCQMGPVDMSVVLPPPYILTPGTHTFELKFTTSDGLYHVGSYYEGVLKFTTR